MLANNTIRTYRMAAGMTALFIVSFLYLRTRSSNNDWESLEAVESQIQKEEEEEEIVLNDLSRCLISSQSPDGIGHQTEAKFSCIATAIFLNMTYIHIPSDQACHGLSEKDLSRLEDFLGLAKVFPVFNSSSDNMTIGIREPTPFVNFCDERSWFQDSIQKDCTSDTTVYTADNCWDYFWCNISNHLDQWHDQVQPLLRRAYFSSPKPYLQEFDAADVNIAVHVRRGDSDVALPLDDIGDFLTRLWEMQPAEVPNNNRSVHVHVHTDDPDPESVREGMVILNSELRNSTTVYGPASFRRITRVIHHFVSADILIISSSSFSNFAAMLSTGTIIHPGQNQIRLGTSALGWFEDIPPDIWERVLDEKPPNN